MGKIKKEKVSGEIIESLTNLRFRILTKEYGELIAYVGGKMKRANIQLLIGDFVEIEVDPAFGKDTHRIVWRK